MKRIVVAEEADDALRRIYRETWQTWGERRADAYVERIRDTYAALARGDAPGRYFRSVDGTELRRIEVGRHVVILTLRADAIQIMGLFHDRMDIGNRSRRLIVRLRARGALLSE